MTTAMYRTRPVTVEISDPIDRDNRDAIVAWMTGHNGAAVALPDGYNAAMVVYTDSGHRDAAWGDRMLRGTRGEFYPIRTEVFADKYEPAP